jgi:HSP20 family molecular chaperone IbpA
MFQLAIRPTLRPHEHTLTRVPAVDIVEHAAGVTLLVDLPGVSRDKLSVQVEQQVLTIEGEVSITTASADDGVTAATPAPRYRRRFSLRKDLDAARISAELRHGVLTLAIPKVASAQPQKIEVSVQ